MKRMRVQKVIGGKDLDVVDVDGLQNRDVTAILEDEEVAEENEKEGGWELEDLKLPSESDTPKVLGRSSIFVAPIPVLKTQDSLSKNMEEKKELYCQSGNGNDQNMNTALFIVGIILLMVVVEEENIEPPKLSNKELNERVEAFITMFRQHLALDARKGRREHTFYVDRKQGDMKKQMNLSSNPVNCFVLKVQG
ncbi:hypothetical protein REPUB_Repub09cG0104100 [Reevesia pubescens]